MLKIKRNFPMTLSVITKGLIHVLAISEDAIVTTDHWKRGRLSNVVIGRYGRLLAFALKPLLSFKQ